MSSSVSQHRPSEGRKPASSLSDFIQYNVASSFFHQALILKTGHHTHTHTHAARQQLTSVTYNMSKWWNMWDGRQRIGNVLFFLSSVLSHLWKPRPPWWRWTWGSSHACVCGWSDAPPTGSAAAHRQSEKDMRRCAQLYDMTHTHVQLNQLTPLIAD